MKKKPKPRRKKLNLGLKNLIWQPCYVGWPIVDNTIDGPCIWIIRTLTELRNVKARITSYMYSLTDYKMVVDT